MLLCLDLVGTFLSLHFALRRAPGGGAAEQVLPEMLHPSASPSSLPLPPPLPCPPPGQTLIFPPALTVRPLFLVLRWEVAGWPGSLGRRSEGN